MIVCDTGPLVALANERDEHYFTANNLFRDLFMVKEAIVLPATVMAEVCYWLNHHGGPEVEAAFLDSVADGTFTLVELTNDDVARIHFVLNKVGQSFRETLVLHGLLKA